MTEQLWHYIDAAGSQCGPITIPQLQELVAQGMIIPETMVWTEALADQWIPASNVEGLFESVAAAMAAAPEAESTPPAPSAVAGETLRTNVAAAPTVVDEPQQPPLAPTTPMIASTPTTQPVTATAVAPAPTAASAVAAAAPAPSAVGEGGMLGVGQLGSEGAVSDAEEESAKKKNPLGLICILLGVIVAGVGGWFMYDQGKSTLAISLLSGGGVLLLLGIILACRGGKSKKEVPAVAAGSSFMGISGASATASPGSPGVVSLDALSSTDAAPVPLAPKANANPLQSPKVATVKPNPLLANPDALRPANRLNTSLSAKPVAAAQDEENKDA